MVEWLKWLINSQVNLKACFDQKRKPIAKKRNEPPTPNYRKADEGSVQ